MEEGGAHEKCQKHTFLALITIFSKNANNKICSESNKNKFWKKNFPGIPDPDFRPDSKISGFFEFFESLT